MSSILACQLVCMSVYSSCSIYLHQTDGTFAVSNLGVVTLRRALDASVTSSYVIIITVSVSQVYGCMQIIV